MPERRTPPTVQFSHQPMRRPDCALELGLTGTLLPRRHDLRLRAAAAIAAPGRPEIAQRCPLDESIPYVRHSYPWLVTPIGLPTLVKRCSPNSAEPRAGQRHWAATKTARAEARGEDRGSAPRRPASRNWAPKWQAR